MRPHPVYRTVLAKAKVCGNGRVLSKKSLRYWLGLGVLALGCASAEPPTAGKDGRSGTRDGRSSAKDGSATTLPCDVDQVRESYCEGLVPLSTAVGAPPPYQNCPAGIEVPSAAAAYPPSERVARFDTHYTEATRRRVQPGHACCYSWCAKVTTADPKDVLPAAGCSQAGASRETYCFPELEGGSREPGPAPYGRCPLAIRPPETVSFSVPKAAPLDLATTQAKRAAGEASCCYGWCSRMPAGI